MLKYNQHKPMKIGIIGSGVLGGSLKRYNLEHTNNEVLVYDKDESKSNTDLDSLIKFADIFVICLPTDEDKDGNLNTKTITEILSRIAEERSDVDVIIRSTLPIGFMGNMALDFDFNFVYIPEFLTEKTAYEDLENSQSMVVGYKKSTEAEMKSMQKFLHTFLPNCFIYFVTYTEAEIIKLATNAFYAMKVTFANEIYDLCEDYGNDAKYEVIKRVLSDNPRIGSNNTDNQGKDVHLRIAQDGKRGFGGKCLPKDTSALAYEMSEINDHHFFDKILSINKAIRK
jgi:UDPglucose 6-dehydrogenase